MSYFSSALTNVFSPNHDSTFVTKWLMGAWAAYRSRVQLGQLEAHQLEDIGVSPEEAKSETMRNFWDVPSHWTE